ncbi:hypothetical protein C4568_03770 [Candidatus Parcubacteria bacterium]|nr:MAG: hypothetical protein C4568_03770 [Candidatus Parcubacteria bacterium]
MTPEDREAIVAVIKETVNGKIDRLNDKMDRHNEIHEQDMKEVRAHIEETKPIIVAYQGGRVLGELIKWLAGVGAAVLLVWSWVAK